MIQCRLLSSFAFWLSLTAFIVANFVSYPMSSSFRLSPKLGILDDGYAFGFPFTHYFVWLGVPSETAFLWPEAVINLILAFGFSLLAAWLFDRYFWKNA